MISLFFLAAVFSLGIFLALFFSGLSKRSNRVRNRFQQGLKLKVTQCTFTREEVAKHNRPEDLWVIIRPKDSREYRVYDLSSYVDEHPGGDGILNNAGGDSTDGFHGPQHPPRAHEILNDFCIGTLRE
eukprot:g6597.t1